MKKSEFSFHVFSYGSGVAFTRALGLIREIIYAQFFGAGMLMDVFRVAFNIPNFLRDLFSEGSLSASFIPICAEKYNSEGKGSAGKFTGLILNNVFFAITIITGILILITPFLIQIFVPGFLKNPYQYHLAISTMRMIFPFLIFITLSSVIMGFLNINKQFTITGISPSIWNLTIILSIIILVPIFKKHSFAIIYSGAIGVVLGGIFQFIFQLPFAFKEKFRFSRFVNFSDPDFIRMLKLWIPMVIGTASYGLMFLVNNFIASFLKEGSISCLSYGFRLMQFPLGIFGVSIFAVSLPRASLESAKKDNIKIRKTMIKSFHMLSLLLLPSAVFLIVDSYDIVKLIYEHGAFSRSSTVLTAQILQLYAIGLFAMGAGKVLSGIYYSFKEARLPMIASIITVIFNILVAVSLLRFLQVRSLALAISLGSLLNFIILTAVFSKRFFRFPFKEFFTNGLSPLLSSLLTGCLFFLFKRNIILFSQNTKILEALGVFTDIIAFIIVYLLFISVFDKNIRDQIKGRLYGKRH